MTKASRFGGLMRIVSGSLYDLPTPSSLSYCWNFGSLLGVFLVFQIVSGLFLSFHYSCSSDVSFFSLVHIMRDVNWGWLVRVFHANGASFFFVLLYVHVGRGLYYGGYRLFNVWLSGVSLFLLSMLVAFLGYVLPWGQMSFWAATVITNLLSAVPYFGGWLVQWMWGGFAVGNATLLRFFSFHFLFPMLLLMLVVFHLYFLHLSGSSNSLGVLGDVDSVSFSPYFVVKDLVGLGLIVMFIVVVGFEFPFIFMDVDNFVESNPMVTPVHIQPEWYFLFAYAILRSVPSKLGGVVSLLLSVLVLYFFPFVFSQSGQGFSFYVSGKGVFWVVVFNWVILTWSGSCEVIGPYDYLAMWFTVLYFVLFMIMSVFVDMEDVMVCWF